MLRVAKSFPNRAFRAVGKRVSAGSPRPSCPELRQEGFTLLEIALTVSLLSIVALSMTLLIVPVARQSRINQELYTAEAEATKLIEAMQSARFDTITTTYPPATELAVAGLPDGKFRIEYVDPAAEPLEIGMTLTWVSATLGDMQRVFTTVRAR